MEHSLNKNKKTGDAMTRIAHTLELAALEMERDRVGTDSSKANDPKSASSSSPACARSVILSD